MGWRAWNDNNNKGRIKKEWKKNKNRQ
jgi:hypothetical protein